MAQFNPRDHDSLIGTKWIDQGKNVYILQGIMLTEDDWYWVMNDINSTTVPVLLSCVLDVENYGYDEYDTCSEHAEEIIRKVEGCHDEASNSTLVFKQQAASAVIVDALDTIICGVFDNEKEFMESLFEPEYGTGWDDLIDFSMSDEVCRMSVLLSCGMTITSTAPTKEVLNWLNDITLKNAKHVDV